jgi:hemolysin activation/secretion protein
MALACFSAPGVGVSDAAAQAIERNLPPAPAPAAPAIAPPNALPQSQDERPLGPNLTGVLLLGLNDPTREDPVEGVSTALVPRMNTPAAQRALRPFLGRPLSRKLIAEIEAAIARLYREAGYPFVALSTPPQPLSAGTLQIRVVEFKDGLVKVTRVKGKAAEQVRAGVRLQPGDPVAAGLLSDDLDWLNRYPFRHTEAVFSPGQSPGTTDLDLRTTLSKPWQVYAGYANSGSASTTFDRYFIGGEIGGLIAPDSLFSYQLTASPDFFDDRGKALAEAHPSYLSQAVRGAVPFAPRQEIEFSLDHVETDAPSQAFIVRQITDEASLGYRAALSNLAATLAGDIDLGLEAKQEQRKTFFSGVDVLSGAVEVCQLYLGWSYAGSDPLGRTLVNATLHISPGRVDARNSGADLATFTKGRVTDADYQYLTLEISRTLRLPAGWSASSSLLAQYADRPLPDTEQLGVGGFDLVRGYTLDDGAFDSALVLRNELRAPALQAFAGRPLLASALQPYAFVDAGYGQDRRFGKIARPLSTGLGADLALGSYATLSASAAYAVNDAAFTKGGDAFVQVKATARY